MAKGTGLVKSRDRYRKLITVFPERKAFYEAEIERVEADITRLGVCKRCGRPLRSQEARDRGYGDECLKKQEAEDATSEL